MAGANNAQMKRAGWKARDITKQRATSGKLSHAAMTAAGHTPKRFSHAAKTIGASKKAARGAQEAAGKARRADLAGRGLRSLAGAMMARRKVTNAPDPHAETRSRIASLEAAQTHGKAVNKIVLGERRKGGDWQPRAAAALVKQGLANEGQAAKYVTPDFGGRHGVPNYEFTNRGATIRRLKDQIGMERPKGKKWDERTIRGIGSFGPGAVVLR